MPPAPSALAPRWGAAIRVWIDRNILGLGREMRLSYLPPLMVYVAAGISGLTAIVGTFYFNVDLVMLEGMAPAENVGWYAAAYRLFNIAVTMVGLVLGTVLYPALSRLSAGSRETLRRVIERWFAFLFATGVFLATTLVMAAEQVVAFLYPAREYAEAATALRLLAPGLAAMYANGIFFLTLFAVRFERRLLLMAAVLAVLNPLANLLLIPLLQQNGAALITSATEAISIGLPRQWRASVSRRIGWRISPISLTSSASRIKRSRPLSGCSRSRPLNMIVTLTFARWLRKRATWPRLVP